MGARPFDWNDLEIFLATARGGTLAAAGRALGLDAATVHRRIAKLEAAMRARLFERSQRGYSLTSAGEDLLAHAQAMDENVTAARRKVEARDTSLSGLVRVATADDLAVTVLSPILRAFREAHPNVAVAVDVRASYADLARREADVAIRFGTKPPEGDVVAKHVARAALALYASRAYLRKHPAPRRLDDLREHAIVRGDVSMAAMSIEQLMDRYADPAKVAIRSESFYARFAAIRDGVGVGFLGCFMGDRERSLRRLPIALPDMPASLTMLVHVDMKRNARVRAFVEHVHGALVAQRAMFEGVREPQPRRSGRR